MQVPACLCGEKDYAIEVHFRKFKKPLSGRVFENFKVLRCLHCGLFRSYPPPDCYETFGKYDQNFYDVLRDKIFMYSAEAIIHYILHVSKVFQKHHPRSLLDVGCGRGELVKIAEKCGIRSIGIDIDEEKIKYGKHVLGAKIERMDLFSAEFNAEFDVVVFNQVLEHLKNSVKAISKSKYWLKRDGILVVAVPNFGSLIRKVLGEWWYEYAPDQHFWYFNPKNLSNILKKTGFYLLTYILSSYMYNPGKIFKISLLNNPKTIKFCYLIERKIAEILKIGDNLIMVAKLRNCEFKR